MNNLDLFAVPQYAIRVVDIPPSGLLIEEKVYTINGTDFQCALPVEQETNQISPQLDRAISLIQEPVRSECLYHVKKLKFMC
jgi:hypothetical protein